MDVNHIIQEIVNHAWVSLKLTFSHLFLILGPALIMAGCMHFVSTRLKSGAWSLLGRKLYLGLFGWLGVGVHELGHAVMCPLFGHRIEKMRLFAPDASAHTLGYVKHSYNPHNPYQVVGNFFIALGPIIMGTAVIWAAARILLPSEVLHEAMAKTWSSGSLKSLDSIWRLALEMWDSGIYLLKSLFSSGGHWPSWIFAYILVCVGSGISLSWEDISSGFSGFLVFTGLTYLIVLLSGFFGGIPREWTFSLEKHVSLSYPFMAFALSLNAIFALLISILNMLKKLARG